MDVKVLKEYQLGDMVASYYLDNTTKNVSLMLLPIGKKPLDWERKKQEIDSLIQVKIAGDIYPGAYAGGSTMRQGESVMKLCYETQTQRFFEEKEEIITTLWDERGYKAEHYLIWKKESKSIETYVKFYNCSLKPIDLEMISSFSLGGLTPFTKGDAYDTLRVHRLRSVWSMEGRLETRTIEELQLEPSWAGHAIRSERFGQVGSMSVNRYFPYLVVEDTINDVFWGVQLAHNASWQMEIYRKDDGVSISGGIADREFGHWMKRLEASESFLTPSAILSVCVGGKIDGISQRLTAAMETQLQQGPDEEKSLPIIFNEYCTTWGCPSHENIVEILNAIKGKGFGYFVVDCGWYKEAGVPWDIAMGDYHISPQLFPDGLDKTVKAIKEAGFKPGIWFEIENVGSASKAYHKEEHLLKRDGKTLTTTMRRFWDMRDPWVENYLTDKVIHMLQEYKFEYMKIDYNETIGLGCDGAESLGEGLRQNMNAAFEFLEKVKREVPGIILENCASGGHRLDPLMMGACSMASFSDAHECNEIPIIAANLHRVILPKQSQIWAVIRKNDSLKRIAYSLANTFLGRMCLSGDVTELTSSQWNVIDKGMDFYKRIAPIISNGFTYRFGTQISSYRHPKGWQGVLRVGETDAFAVYHVFDGEINDTYTIEIPDGSAYEIECVFSDSEVFVELKEKKLIIKDMENWKVVAVYLKGGIGNE
ncbi:MAG: glycoside hydrolase family 36 protein [Velocimicrobium sp.]